MDEQTEQSQQQCQQLENKLNDQTDQLEVKLMKQLEAKLKEHSDELEAKLKEQSDNLEAKLKEHSEKQFQEAVRQFAECYKVYTVYCSIIRWQYL